MDISFAELALVVGLSTNVPAGVAPNDLICLSRNVYHEARGEPYTGQIAVAYLTLNRVASPRFPDDVCDVVTEDRGAKSWDCQFSWWCDGKNDTPFDQNAFAMAIKVSIGALTGEMQNPVPGATHYYAYNLVTPNWSYAMAETNVIGGHRYMKE